MKVWGEVMRLCRALFLILSIPFMAGAREAPLNIALGKPYTFSPKPSYPHCTDKDDAIQLTDGVYTKGRMWVQQGCVGWRKAQPVIITIDLKQRQPVCGLSWSTAAGVANVYWPQNLRVFVSDDKKEWRLLGDLREMEDSEQPPPLGEYSNFRFTTRKMRGCGRYLSIVAHSPRFCFVDEIEVWRGSDAWLSEQPSGRVVSDPIQFYTISLVHDGISSRVRQDIKAICAQATTIGGDALRRELEGLAQPLLSRVCEYVESFTANQQTILPYQGLHTEALALNAKVLRAQGIHQPLLWQGNRWDPLTLYALPPAERTNEPLAIDLMRNETRGATFNITNPYNAPLELALEVKGGAPELRIELRETLFTDTTTHEPVGSALKLLAPGADGGARLLVPAGCTRQVWVSCQRPTAKAGVYKGVVAISDIKRRWRREQALQVRIRPLDFPERPVLHVGGWDYTQGVADYYKAPGNLTANLAMMRTLHVDSPWATSAVSPKGAAFDAQGALTNKASLDFETWDAWRERWPVARNYCVFLSVSDRFHGERMGTPRFVRMVGDWMRSWVEHIKTQGVEPRQLVLLLVDEPHENGQDRIIIEWANAIKAAEPGVTIFEDPTYRDPTKGLPEMFAVSDVLCPNTPMMLGAGKPFRDFYVEQQRQGKTLWLYSCSGPARLLDPLTYYRAQMWRAFQMGAEGCFYWAFGCGGGIGDSWRAYLQRTEYSPYFVSATDVMEAKQSAAIREGVQDYEYLRMLRDKLAVERKLGKNTAWIREAEDMLERGVADVLLEVRPDNLRWEVAKDRGRMDQARLRILDLLE